MLNIWMTQTMKHETKNENASQSNTDAVVKLDEKEMEQLKKEVDAENTDTSNVHEVPSKLGIASPLNVYGHRHGQLAITLIACELIKSKIITEEMNDEDVKSVIVEAFNLLAKLYKTSDFDLIKTIEAAFVSGFIKKENGWCANVKEINKEHYTGLLATGVMYTFGYTDLLRLLINETFKLIVPFFDYLNFTPYDIVTWSMPNVTESDHHSGLFFTHLIRYNNMLKDDYRPLRFKQGVLELEENADYVLDPDLKRDGILG